MPRLCEFGRHPSPNTTIDEADLVLAIHDNGDAPRLRPGTTNVIELDEDDLEEWVYRFALRGGPFPSSFNNDDLEELDLFPSAHAMSVELHLGLPGVVKKLEDDLDA